MKTYHALIARGHSYKLSYCGALVRGFEGINGSLSVDAEDRVDAFLKIYRQVSSEGVEITGLRVDGQPFMLGFSTEEWEAILKADVRIEEAIVPRNGGIQIQGIHDTPFG